MARIVIPGGGIAATGTTAGPPTSGAHLVGEVRVDTVGTLWTCTVAGTPGIWVSATGNELAFAKLTAAPANLGPAVADIPGLAVTLTPPTSQVMLKLALPSLTKNTSAGWVIGWITDNAGGVVNRNTTTISTVGGFGGLMVEAKVTGLTAGVAVTYKARIQCQADTVTVSASTPDPVPFLQARTV